MLKKDRILLEERIPIKTIEEPFCRRCMDNIDTEKTLCGTCESPPSIVNDWYFNNVKCIGKYNYFNDNDFKIPINILSIVVGLLKFNKSFIRINEYAGNLLADGFFQIINNFSNVFEDTKFLAFSPNFDKSEINQCSYIINPLLTKLDKIGINIVDITGNIERVKDVGKNKNKPLIQRFQDIKGVHKVNGIDLNGAKTVIIDDVYTTGSTCWDLSRALKEKNAGEINVLAAGRHILYNEWIETKYNNFYELILYFSNLDFDRKRKIIDKVKIEEISISQENQINAWFKGSLDEYRLIINFKDKLVKHNCYDFVEKKCYNKRFCKHITKTFIKIKAEKGEELAKSLLNQMYKSLDEWVFEDY